MVCNRIFAFRSLCLAGLGFAAAVQAEATGFTFSFTGRRGTFSGGGTLTATDNLDGTFTATSGLMTVTAGNAWDAYSGAYTLTGDANAPSSASSPSGFFYYDDQLSPSNNATLLDGSGLLFQQGQTEVNLWGNGGVDNYTFYLHDPVTGANVAENGTFTLTQAPPPVPGPFTMALYAAGLGLAFARRRRR